MKMKIFKYKINKQACFAYWLQYIANWGFNKKQSEKEYYLDIIGELTPQEKRQIKKAKLFLKKDKLGYNWLWSRYAGKVIYNNMLKKEWQAIYEKLKPVFEKVWRKEQLKLEKWKNYLPDLTNNIDIKDVIKRSEKFFNIKINFPVVVQLFCHGNKEGAAGGSKRGFNNLFIALSNMDKKYASNALNTLIHELIHLMLYKSKLEKLLKIAWKQVIDNKKLPKTKNSPSWGHLIRESLTYSIAGRNFSYLHHRIKSPFYMKISDKRKLEKFNYSDHKKDFSFQAQTVAFKIKDLTIKYLDNKKKMDKKFADNLIKYWIKYRKI